MYKVPNTKESKEYGANRGWRNTSITQNGNVKAQTKSVNNNVFQEKYLQHRLRLVHEYCLPTL